MKVSNLTYWSVFGKGGGVIFVTEANSLKDTEIFVLSEMYFLFS